MAKYRIYVGKSVRGDLSSIPEKDVIRIVEVIGALADDPRPPQSRKLSGENKYRLRCGVYRVLYEVKETELTIFVVRARHRKAVYR